MWRKIQNNWRSLNSRNSNFLCDIIYDFNICGTSHYLLHGKSEVGNCIDVRRYVDLVTDPHLSL